jgi:hypothetical protein
VKLYFPFGSEVVLGALVGPPESAIDTPEIVGPVTVPEIVQFVEQLADVTDKVKDCVAFGGTLLLAVMVIGLTEAEVAIPLIVAVPSWLSTNVRGAGNDPEVIARAGDGLPVVVTVKVPLTLTVKVALLLLVICGGALTVIVTVDVALLPAALVTVNV